MVHNAHDFAVYEARIKTYVTVDGTYFRVNGDREVVPLTEDDRAFLTEWKHLPAMTDEAVERAISG